MMTNNVQKATLAMAAAILAITVLSYFTLATPVAAQTSTSSTGSSATTSGRTQAHAWAQGSPAANDRPFRQGRFMFGEEGPGQNLVNISVGKTFTVTSTQGKYFVAGTPGNNGTASGTLAFTVTGRFYSGYTLSVTGGSLTVAGSTYTISSGSAQMDRGANGAVGQGSTTPSGQFNFRAMAHGTFVGSTGLVSLDLQSGSSEYLVFLAGNISG